MNGPVGERKQANLMAMRKTFLDAMADGGEVSLAVRDILKFTSKPKSSR